MTFFSKISSYFRGLTRLWSDRKPPQNRPHFYSKNAWSYVSRSKRTPAMGLYLRLNAPQ
uniref:Uncharacterized protein n=1 Tax=Myoviridae sp. ctKHS5 TaxID=2823541 RepID=A0A8S5L7Z2_9CAUD|nr:MAG TPA: hypothetical protein [Myoviridae sp. ctKHS5]